MEKILISACLVGENCKYDGGNNLNPKIEALLEKYDLIPFCPEVEGGLDTPRNPSEIKGESVQISFSDASSPSVIHDTSDSSAIYVLMPMRV